VLNFITLLIIFTKLTDQNNLILKEKNDIKRAIRKNLEDIYIS